VFDVLVRGHEWGGKDLSSKTLYQVIFVFAFWVLDTRTCVFLLYLRCYHTRLRWMHTSMVLTFWRLERGNSSLSFLPSLSLSSHFSTFLPDKLLRTLVLSQGKFRDGWKCETRSVRPTCETQADQSLVNVASVRLLLIGILIKLRRNWSHNGKLTSIGELPLCSLAVTCVRSSHRTEVCDHYWAFAFRYVVALSPSVHSLS